VPDPALLPDFNSIEIILSGVPWSKIVTYRLAILLAGECSTLPIYPESIRKTASFALSDRATAAVEQRIDWECLPKRHEISYPSAQGEPINWSFLKQA